MRRKIRIDLGQKPSSAKEEATIERKRQNWAATNKGADQSENPFLAAIRPGTKTSGDGQETEEEISRRLANFEYGNFPGYFNYRNKAAVTEQKTAPSTTTDITDTQASGEPRPSVSNDEHDDNHQEQHQDQQSSVVDDERLSHLKREWFEDKVVLDIGCNRGHITYSIARLYGPKFVIGTDIDQRMINMANKDLHLHLSESIIKDARDCRRQEIILNNNPSDINLNCNKTDTTTTTITATTSGEGANVTDTDSVLECDNEMAAGGGGANDDDKSPRLPLSSYVTLGPLALGLAGADNEQPGADAGANDSGDVDISVANRARESRPFPNNLLFIQHNYVLASDELVARQEPQFDTIVCLSVTKWVHLNYGDAGVQRLFKRVYRHLRPGGLFVLEAQPYDNYARRKRMAERLRRNFYALEFLPDHFDAYLLGAQVGFSRLVHESRTQHQCGGFRRPIKVFAK